MRGTEGVIRTAIAGAGLVAEYMPVARVSDGALVGVEALLRIDDPVLGRILPDRFIGVSELSGQIVTLGQWILTRAVAQAAEWVGLVEGRDFRMAVNVSARQLTDRRLPGEVARLLEKENLSPRHLSLELTESRPLAGSVTLRNLTDLGALGVGLSLDDFGTGYSPLTYLKRYPIDTIKVDRTFVDDMIEDATSRAIVSALIWLGRELGLTTVAEGVRTSAQLAMLRSLGCDLFQGEYLSLALPAPAVTQLLLQGSPSS